MSSHYSTAGLPDWLKRPPISDYLARFFSAVDRAARAADDAVAARDEFIEQLSQLPKLAEHASELRTKDILTQQELAAEASCSTRKIQDLTAKGLLPVSYALGKKMPRYPRSAIEKLLTPETPAEKLDGVRLAAG